VSKKKTEADYIYLGEKMGFTWIPTPIKTINDRVEWICENNHYFDASYSNIRAGWKCKYCSGNYQRIIRDYEVLAKLSSLSWVAHRMPFRTTEKTTWQCLKCNSVFEKSYRSIQNSKIGCSKCYGGVRKTEDAGKNPLIFKDAISGSREMVKSLEGIQLSFNLQGE